MTKQLGVRILLGLWVACLITALVLTTLMVTDRDRVSAPPMPQVPPLVTTTTTTTTTVLSLPPQSPAVPPRAPAPILTAPRLTAAPTTTEAPPDYCAVALAYLSAHAASGYAHYCRPGASLASSPYHGYPVYSYTCKQGNTFRCPDGVSEIVIFAPQCPLSYENEAANSYWPWATWSGGILYPGETFEGHTWDPYGRGC